MLDSTEIEANYNKKHKVEQRIIFNETQNTIIKKYCTIHIKTKK